MTQPLFTIVIPTINRSDLVVRAVESALAQTYPNVEVIVSDNASTDDTWAVLADYSKRGVRLYRHETRLPVKEHGWFLIQEARGEFFIGLSDDDYLEPDFVAQASALLEKYPDLSFVYTGCVNHYDDETVRSQVGPEIEDGLDFMLAHYKGAREVCWCACVTRVKDLRLVGPLPDGRIMGDMFYWTKIAFMGPVGCASAPLSHYVALRHKGDNESRTTSVVRWAREQVELLGEVLKMTASHTNDSSYLADLQKNGDEYVARSIANQFIWNRISGASRGQLLRDLGPIVKLATITSSSAARIAASIILPPWALRRLVLRDARRLARSRSQKPAV